VVTSASPAEGKTFTAVNLALTQAQLESPVLLADRAHLLAMPALSGGSPSPPVVMAAVPAVTAPAEGAEKPEALPTR